jgi:hypothetical protein
MKFVGVNLKPGKSSNKNTLYFSTSFGANGNELLDSFSDSFLEDRNIYYLYHQSIAIYM